MARKSAELLPDPANGDTERSHDDQPEARLGTPSNPEHFYKATHAAEVLVGNYIKAPETTSKEANNEEPVKKLDSTELLAHNLDRFEKGEPVEREYELRHEIKGEDNHAKSSSSGVESLGSILKSKNQDLGPLSSSQASPEGDSPSLLRPHGLHKKTTTHLSRLQLTMVGVGIGVVLSLLIILFYVRYVG